MNKTSPKKHQGATALGAYFERAFKKCRVIACHGVLDFTLPVSFVSSPGDITAIRAGCASRADMKILAKHLLLDAINDRLRSGQGLPDIR